MGSSAILKINFIKNEIDTEPTYQRNSDIWDTEKRQLLIDSILNDFDIPKIYFHELSKPYLLPNRKYAKYAIIDGKQRLESIFRFLENKFPLSEDFEFFENQSVKARGLTYSEMAARYPELKVAFDSYSLPVVLVATDDIDLIEEMFSRLNEAVPLSSAEKRNALGGPIPKIIREVAAHEFFAKKVNFSNKRYQHREVAVRLLFLEKTIAIQNRIVDTKRIFLDEFVKEYRNPDKGRLVEANELKTKVCSILTQMTKIFGDKDPLLTRQSTVPIYYLLFRYAIEQTTVERISRRMLSEFAEKVAKNRKTAEEDITKADFDLLQFDRMTIQGTNDASSIKERLRIISEVFNLVPTRFT